MNIKQLKIALGALKRCFYDTRLDNLGFCGKNVKLEYPISFHNPRNVFLEDNVIIKSDSLVINTTGKLIMKKNSGAAQRFTVITGNHHPVKNKLFFESVKHRLADIQSAKPPVHLFKTKRFYFEVLFQNEASLLEQNQTAFKWTSNPI